VIEELQPTLLIDEADTFLQGNDELRGILNSGYSRKTAFVLRASSPNTAPRLPLPRDECGTPPRFPLPLDERGTPPRFPLPEGEGRVRGNGSSGLPSSTASQLAKFSCCCHKI